MNEEIISTVFSLIGKKNIFHKLQKNKVHSLTLQYLHLNKPNKNLIF